MVRAEWAGEQKFGDVRNNFKENMYACIFYKFYVSSRARNRFIGNSLKSQSSKQKFSLSSLLT